MPLSDQQLRDMHERGVLVATHQGETIAMGSLRVASDSPSDAAPRLDLHFETEILRCAMRVPAARLEGLAASWDGSMYRYYLPAGEQMWSPGKAPSRSSPPLDNPVIETFSLPANVGAIRTPVKLSHRANEEPKR